MKAETIRQKQDTLNKLILELASEPLEEDKDKIKSKALTFNDIYSDGFHHLYSEFLPLITRLFEENEFDPEILVTNLATIKTYAESDYQRENNIFNDHALSSVRKLCDHINLEVARMNYSTSTYQRLVSTSKALQDTDKALQDAQKKVDEATDKIKDSHGQLITILSIFAAIVITFAGGISLLGSALTSVADAPLLDLLLIVFACGIILIDAVTALIYAVSKLAGKSILSGCEKKECNCLNDKGKPKCKGITKLRKRLPFVFWSNIILISLFLVILVLYICNIKFAFIY